ncbi:MAG: cyclic pyranopterin monophosphate synthase MoaC [Planctomycetota bacterium]|nr:cyclic pyranopterin monophosphate synthase MoaC [Planctomycetota bacterium]
MRRSSKTACPAMADVSGKKITSRAAVAEGFVRLSPEALMLIREGRLPKGDPLSVARIAGISAAKRTPEIVPLCHQILLDAVSVELEVAGGGVRIEARAAARERTGVEMEALTAVAAAALTVYDMCKSVDRSAEITDVHLLEKSGGRSGHYVRKRERKGGRGQSSVG